jgi:hypothetical protein
MLEKAKHQFNKNKSKYELLKLMFKSGDSKVHNYLLDSMFIFVPCKYIGEQKFSNYTKLLLSLCLLK